MTLLFILAALMAGIGALGVTFLIVRAITRKDEYEVVPITYHYDIGWIEYDEPDWKWPNENEPHSRN